jgi:hypothetical protein
VQVAKRFIAAVSLFAIVTAIAGCTPKTTPMPILVSPGADGWPVVSVPVCAGDRVTFAVIHARPGNGDVDHREAVSQPVGDRVVEFQLSRDSIRAGSISKDVPVTNFTPYSNVPTARSDLGWFYVETGRFRAEVDFGSGWAVTLDPLVVFGVAGTDDNAYHKSVTLQAGQDVINQWCDKSR